MRYFLDLEFHEQGPNHPIVPISLGLVSEDGHQFYGVNTDYDWNHSTPWLVHNVKPTLSLIAEHTVHCPARDHMAPQILHFLDLTSDGNDPEFWGYYADYDWVVFCQIFGDMSDLPGNFPYYCHDLRQWLDEHGYEDVFQADSGHNALQDAEWARDTYLQLVKED